MTSSTILITSADDRYFELVKACIQSVRDKPQSRQISLGFLDVGCTEEQRDWLQSRVDFLQEPQWEFDFPSRLEKPSFLRGLFARPFLRRYFPDFEVYLWLDADAWLQDWYALALLYAGACRRRGMAIVPEIDRCSVWQYGGLPKYWRTAQEWYAAAFGEKVALKLYSFPMLNAGVFALHRDAPHWERWEERSLAGRAQLLHRADRPAGADQPVGADRPAGAEPCHLFAGALQAYGDATSVV